MFQRFRSHEKVQQRQKKSCTCPTKSCRYKYMEYENRTPFTNRPAGSSSFPNAKKLHQPRTNYPGRPSSNPPVPPSQNPAIVTYLRTSRIPCACHRKRNGNIQASRDRQFFFTILASKCLWRLPFPEQAELLKNTASYVIEKPRSHKFMSLFTWSSSQHVFWWTTCCNFAQVGNYNF